MPYDHCCGPLHEGAAAPTAERLMRSRYSAFVRGDAQYLLASWHPSTRPERVELDASQAWTGLQVLQTTGGTFLEATGAVSFVARYTVDGRPGVVRETSRFARDGRRWAYVGPVAGGEAAAVR